MTYFQVTPVFLAKIKFWRKNPNIWKFRFSMGFLFSAQCKKLLLLQEQGCWLLLFGIFDLFYNHDEKDKRRYCDRERGSTVIVSSIETYTIGYSFCLTLWDHHTQPSVSVQDVLSSLDSSVSVTTCWKQKRNHWNIKRRMQHFWTRVVVVLRPTPT